MREIETPVDGATARRLLSPTRDPNKPMSRSRYSAILGAMGISGARLVFVSQITRWLREHPEFREQDYYAKKELRVGQVLPVKAGVHRGEFVVEEISPDGRPTLLRAA